MQITTIQLIKIMTTTSSYLVLDDTLQLAMSSMIRHYENSIKELEKQGVEKSELYCYAREVRQIKEMLRKNNTITSTSSLSDSTIKLKID